MTTTRWDLRNVTLLAVVLVLLALPSPPAGSHVSASRPSAQSSQTPVGAPALVVPTTLTVAASGYQRSPNFWGTTISANARLMPDEAAILNATGTKVLVWPGANAGDQMNLVNDTILKVNATSLTWKAPLTNETQFIQLCRDVSCTAILQVPGEIDNPSIAAGEVNYTERTLGFAPAYWEIGNEPELWQDWGVPWDQWNLPNASSTILPGQYAWMVHNYTSVLRTADPNIRILGLAGTGRPQTPPIPLSTWINATVAVNGPALAGIAYHVYTAGRYGSPTLTQFYAADADPYGVAARVHSARSAISDTMNATCPGCPDPPVLQTELGSALSHFQFTNLSQGFPGGLSMAASEVQGLDLNMTTIDVFTTQLDTSNSWFSSNGTVRPDYTIYAQFLSHLGTYVYPATLRPPSGGGYNGWNTSLADNLYAIETEAPVDHGRADLLVVNQNVTTNVSFTPQLSGIAAGTPTELWEWSGRPYYSVSNASWWVEPTTAQAQSLEFPSGLPPSWTLPPQTIALFQAYPAGGAPVTFEQSGLPGGTRWYLSVDGMTMESTDANLTEFLYAGGHALAPVPLPLPLGSLKPNPQEREQAFPPGSVSVGSTAQVVPVPYQQQWSVAVNLAPPGDGYVVPAYGWANASLPQVLTAVTQPGYVVGSWVGTGKGSFTGSGPIATLFAKGPLVENVTFVRAYHVNLFENGLPSGTSWSATVQGITENTTSHTLTFSEANGTHLFSVGSVSGYATAALPPSLTVSGADLTLDVNFTPVGPLFQVAFQETGLPTGDPWFVLVDGTRYGSTGPTTSALVGNGTHAWWVGNSNGYEPVRRSGTVAVSGAPQVVPVSFEPFQFQVVVNTTGLAAGTDWTLLLGGASLTVSATFESFGEPNGSYVWAAIPPAGYQASPSHGNFTLQGLSVFFLIRFSSSGSVSAGPFGWAPSTWAAVGLAAVLGGVLLGTAVLVLLRRSKRPAVRGSGRARTKSTPQERPAPKGGREATDASSSDDGPPSGGASEKGNS